MVDIADVINKGANVMTAGTNLMMAINEVYNMGYIEQIQEYVALLRQRIAEIMAMWAGIGLFPPTCPEGYTYNPQTGECEPVIYPPPEQNTGLEKPPKVFYHGYELPRAPGEAGSLILSMEYWFSPVPHKALEGRIRYTSLLTENEYAYLDIPIPQMTGRPIGAVIIPIAGIVDKGVIEILEVKNLLTGEYRPVSWIYHYDMQDLINVPYRPYPLQSETPWEVG